MFLCNFIYIFLAIIIILVERNYGYNHCTDPRTYTCEDGYKPTYQDVRSGLSCDGDGCDTSLADDSIYCETAEEFCTSTILSRNSPVYSFNGTTGVRHCDAKERTIPTVNYLHTSCADGKTINAHNLLQFCKKVARSHKDEKLRSEELKRCNFVKKGKTIEEIKSRGDVFCEYVLLYCNEKHT